MGDTDRSRDQHPDNVIFWRLSALEEAMKFHDGQLRELRNGLDQVPDRMSREFPTKLELQRDYVRLDDIRQAAGDSREVWTLRIIAFGTVASVVLGALSLVHG